MLTALATQASIAIRNARLIEELARSRAVIERRAEAEQALREIAARITAIREPGDLLQHVVDEARRLLRADGAVIDQFDPESQTLAWAYDAGLTEEQREAVRVRARCGSARACPGTAVAERRVIAAGDYLAGEFQHVVETDQMAALDRHRRPDRRADHRRRGAARRDRGLPAATSTPSTRSTPRSSAASPTRRPSRSRTPG